MTFFKPFVQIKLQRAAVSIGYKYEYVVYCLKRAKPVHRHLKQYAPYTRIPVAFLNIKLRQAPHIFALDRLEIKKGIA